MTSEALPHWDLSNVYPGLESKEFQQAVAHLEASLDELDEYLVRYRVERGGEVPDRGPSAVADIKGGYLDRMNAVLRFYRTLASYVYGFYCTDSYDAMPRRIQSELDALQVRLERQEVLFRVGSGRWRRIGGGSRRHWRWRGRSGITHSSCGRRRSRPAT